MTAASSPPDDTPPQQGEAMNCTCSMGMTMGPCIVHFPHRQNVVAGPPPVAPDDTPTRLCTQNGTPLAVCDIELRLRDMAELRAEVSRLREALTLSEGQDLPRLSLDYSETAALVEARIRLEADVREHQYRIKRALELLEGDTFGNIQAAIIVLSGQ